MRTVVDKYVHPTFTLLSSYTFSISSIQLFKIINKFYQYPRYFCMNNTDYKSIKYFYNIHRNT